MGAGAAAVGVRTVYEGLWCMSGGVIDDAAGAGAGFPIWEEMGAAGWRSMRVEGTVAGAGCATFGVIKLGRALDGVGADSRETWPLRLTSLRPAWSARAPGLISGAAGIDGGFCGRMLGTVEREMGTPEREGDAGDGPARLAPLFRGLSSLSVFRPGPSARGSSSRRFPRSEDGSGLSGLTGR